MSDADADELEEIRRRKRERLERRLDAGADAKAADAGDATDSRAASGGTGATDDRSGSATPSEPIHVESETEFSAVVDAHDVVLVDFYADWCGPCEMLEPTVAALARDSPAAVAKVDVDAHQGLASRYGVRGVPTLLLFSGGEPVERVVGVRDQGSLASLVAEYAG
jgi:thioredoxin 1